MRKVLDESGRSMVRSVASWERRWPMLAKHEDVWHMSSLPYQCWRRWGELGWGFFFGEVGKLFGKMNDFRKNDGCLGVYICLVIHKREGGRLGVEKMKVNSVLNRHWTLDPIWLKNFFWYLSEIFLLLLACFCCFPCVFTTFFWVLQKIRPPPPGLTEKTPGRHHPSGSRRDVAPARVRHGASPNTSPPSRQRWHRRGGGEGWRVVKGDVRL